jgi:hypothetical protein
VTSLSPFLSIILTGRNDEHGVDFRSRCFRTLQFNHRELSERGISHEFVFVEWAPEVGRPLLVDLVAEAIPTAEPRWFTGYVVERQYHDALSLNPRLEYLEFLAKNVGIRRARGSFILATNCDIFLGRRILQRLQDRDLEPRTVYRAARHDLKLSFDQSSLGWERLEDADSLEGPPPILKPPLLRGGTGDFVLLDRETFGHLRGFNEIYRVARIGIDHNFLVKASSEGIPIIDIGGPVYHINHAGSFRISRDLYAGREAEAPWGDARWHAHAVVYDNPSNWGLQDAPVRRRNELSSVLQFSWKAVPQLVDLRRIVLPVPAKA